MRLLKYAVVALAVASGCSPAASVDTPGEVSDPAPRSAVADPSVATEPAPKPSNRPDPELSYDRAVGWEVRVPFAPGQTSRKRDPDAYLTIAYASLDDIDLARMVIRGRGRLEDRSLIATPDELCHPSFVRVVQQLQPDRLLLRIRGDWAASHAQCVLSLGVERLYLGLCPDDGETIWACDGDAQIATLLAAPELHPLVRGLAFGAGDPSTLEVVRSLPNLEYVQFRGPMLEKVTPEHAALFCSLPHLRYFDSLDATRAGAQLVPPLRCVLRLQTFIAPNLSERGEWSPTKMPPHPADGPCALRRILVWSLDDREREILARCPSLTEREIIDPDD